MPLTAKKRVRWYLDTEFYEDGSTIDLISIGLVSADGREYYRETDFAKSKASGSVWLKQNVLPHLTGDECSRMKIANEIRELVLSNDERPEFWAYFADYDWVALCQLYGPMIALPTGFPFYCHDLKQLMAENGIDEDLLPDQQSARHHALADAIWNRDVHALLEHEIRYRTGKKLQKAVRESLRVSSNGTVVYELDGDFYPICSIQDLTKEH